MDLKQTSKIKFALEKLPIDTRDYSHHKEFGTLGISQLPSQDFTVYDSFRYTIKFGDTLSAIALKFGYSIKQLCDENKIENPNKIKVGQKIAIPARPINILNQLDLDFCTGFTTCELQYLLYGIPFDPLYQMAKIKQLRGEYTEFGANLRDECNSIIKYGSLPFILSPYVHKNSPQDKKRDFLANWLNYPTGLDIKASKYKDMSYFTVDGTYDVFDNIRACLWKHRQERRGVTFGLFWHAEWTESPNGIISSVMPTASVGGGHNMAIIGQKTINGELYLVFQQTWGPTAGDHGLYYFPRTIIDQIAQQGYGAFTFSRIDNSGLKYTGWFNNLLTTIISRFNSI